MDPAVSCLILLGVMAVLFITELVPLSVTAIGGAIACGYLNFIPDEEVFLGLAHPTVILFSGMFIVGAAMFHTGLAHRIGILIVKRAGKSEGSLLIYIMLVAAALSAFLSNTGTAACLLPVVMGICAAAKISTSRQLIPLAYAVCSGGMITLLGTPPNILISGALTNFGYEPFGLFDFAWVGIPITIVTILYMYFLGRHLLPHSELLPAEFARDLNEGVDNVPKQIISGLILVACIVVMTLGMKRITIEMTAIIGALVCVLTGCLTEKQAYESIDWATIFLFAGIMPVSNALYNTGAGEMIAEWALKMLGGAPTPFVMTAAIFLITAALTQFMSNSAVAALITPIGLAISQEMNIAPHTFLMTICVAASCAFVTPIGTPPCTLMLGPGRYKFRDYVKVGLPLLLLCFLVAMAIIPAKWGY